MNNLDKIDILSLNEVELTALVVELGEKSFRSKQVFKWLHKVGVTSFEEMTDISKDLRAKLVERCFFATVVEKRRQTAADGTEKFLFELYDGNTIESVLMVHDYGTSLCISTQVGCRMGCRFCASTLGGKVRDLLASEILSQIYQCGILSGKRVDGVVLMGIGEPLDNFDNVVKFLEIVKTENGLNLSHRHISLSTCGMVPQIYELAELKLQITLSISLHASNDRMRNSIMPVNSSYPIDELMRACRRYFKVTHRRISYEYALIAGVNDNVETAKELIRLLKGQGCHVNLIPVNPVKEAGYLKTGKKEAFLFRDTLIAAGLTSTIRRELGAEIDAACGQLRRNDKEI